MKKTIMFLGVLSLGLAQAQQYDGKVGVNTDQPNATLNVKSKTGTTKSTKNFELQNAADKKLVTVLDNGQTGIGTDIPKEQLHVIGGIRTERSDKLGGYLDLVNSSKTGNGNEAKAGMWRLYNMTDSYANGLHFWAYPEDNGANPLKGGTIMVLADTGNVGIGTGTSNTPTEKLHIGTGNVRINTLPTHAGADSDNIVVVDNDGVLKSVDRNSLNNNDEWQYDPATKRVNLKRTASADTKVFYNQHGSYINTNMLNETTSFFDYNTKTIQQSTPFEYDKLANNLLLKKITPNTYMPLDSNGRYSLSMNSNSMYIEDTKDDGKSIILTGQSTGLGTAPTNTKDYLLLRGTKIDASHTGTGDAKYIVGNYSDARLERGKSTGYVYGGRFTASYATDQSSNYQTGMQIFNQVLKTAGGTINNMEGMNAYMSIVNENALTVKELKGLNITRSFEPKAPLNITNAVGLHYVGIDVEEIKKKNNNLTLTNNYGLKIGDIKGAATNYAIHTGAGKVYLGDEVEVKGSIKVASSTKTDPCGDDNKGTIRFDATAKKFQGCTGTEWKDLHN